VRVDVGRVRRPVPQALAGSAGLAGLVGLALLAGLLLLDQTLQHERREVAGLAVIAAMWLAFAGAGCAVGRLDVRAGTRLAVAGGAVLQLVALRVPPFSTDDHLRYAWDGRVQAAGIDPYRYPPGAPELAGLRDAWLFPDGVTPLLNHPGDRTIYPPVAQAWFWLVHVASGGHGQGRALQLGSAALAVATSALIVRLLRRTGGDPRRVVWWAWCPTVLLESGGNAHVDVLGALLVVAALGSLVDHRWGRSGALLGLAIAVKVLPALVAVGVPPRRSLRVGLAAALAVALVYLPHVAVLGPDVTGFLGGYLGEESRDRFALLRFVLGDGLGLGLLVQPAALAVLAGTALATWRWAGRGTGRGAVSGADRPWLPAATMVGVGLLVLTPPYPWYGLLLVPLVALGAGRAWLGVCAAAYLVYAAAPLGQAYGGTRVIGYGLAALALAATYGWRWAGRIRGRSGSVAEPALAR
jgi:Glycosyltransferase family 87